MASLSCGTDAEMLGSLMMLDLGLEREGAEFGEVIGDALLGREKVGEGGEDAAGEGDVARLDVDARVLGKGLHDRQERVGGERGGFVGLGVDDRRIRGHDEKESSSRKRR